MHEANTGLSYSGARYYDPTLGRFISIDPVGFSAKNPLTFNRYDYADNNPYRYIDPTGDFSWPSFMNDVEGFNNYVGANRDQIEVGILTLGIAPAAEAVGVVGKFATDEAINGIEDVAVDIENKSNTVATASNSEGGGLIIGKLEDINNVSKLRTGDYTLNLPDKGSPKANWAQNYSELRYQMRSVNSIRDVTGWDHESASFSKNTGFLRAERNVLQNRGWSFDPTTNIWSAP